MSPEPRSSSDTSMSASPKRKSPVILVFPSSEPASPPLRAVTSQDSITKFSPPASNSTRSNPPSTRKRPSNINQGSRFPPRTPTNGRQCTNCGETDTPQWRASKPYVPSLRYFLSTPVSCFLPSPYRTAPNISFISPDSG
ncbi:hypothetical protein I350_00504 [Cryptococcus amylolentus CBS 6273]|uniref:GATA-type domain-containing protein n=1 Tax=Cryptococcus amylolentus CBS 6273 TaxID=1296118 RepID=A0A1E3KF64_9TREE|nr:hypothetical protein I350_00504 [Cryptococcus amylolentus CBS 6273]